MAKEAPCEHHSAGAASSGMANQYAGGVITFRESVPLCVKAGGMALSRALLNGRLLEHFRIENEYSQCENALVTSLHSIVQNS